MDVEKIKKLQAQAKANKGGAKGFRKPVRATGTSESDDKKLSLALKKLGVQPIQGVEEVNMFQDNGNVLHFGAPKVHAAVPSNTYAIYGNGQDKDMAELVPGILNQLGPDSLASLKRMAESYNAAQAAQAGKGAAAEPDDDDLPDLVENFDVDEKAGDAPAASSLEELE